MRAIGVFEEVKDSLFFQQAGHKVEIRLPILHTVFVFGRSILEFPAKIGEAQILKDLRHDLLSRLVLKDAACLLYTSDAADE